MQNTSQLEVQLLQKGRSEPQGLQNEEEEEEEEEKDRDHDERGQLQVQEREQIQGLIIRYTKEKKDREKAE